MKDLAEILEGIQLDVAVELQAALAARIAKLKPSRAARLDERDRAIKALAADFYHAEPSRQGRAKWIAGDLSHVRPNPPGRPPAGRRAALARVLALCEGKPPGRYQIENILAGKRR